MRQAIGEFFQSIGFTRKTEHTEAPRTQHATVIQNVNQANTHQMRDQVEQQTSLASLTFTDASDMNALKEKFPDAKLKDLAILVQNGYTNEDNFEEDIKEAMQGYGDYLQPLSFEEVVQMVQEPIDPETESKLEAEIDQRIRQENGENVELPDEEIMQDVKHVHVNKKVTAHGSAMAIQNMYEQDPVFWKQVGFTNKNLRSLKKDADFLDKEMAKIKTEKKDLNAQVAKQKDTIKTVDSIISQGY